MKKEDTEEEIVWLTEDSVFDLLLLLCDVLHDEGYVRSSYRTEQLIDEFLVETGRCEIPKRQPVILNGEDLYRHASTKSPLSKGPEFMHRSQRENYFVRAHQQGSKRLVG